MPQHEDASFPEWKTMLMLLYHNDVISVSLWFVGLSVTVIQQKQRFVALFLLEQSTIKMLHLEE